MSDRHASNPFVPRLGIALPMMLAAASAVAPAVATPFWPEHAIKKLGERALSLELKVKTEKCGGLSSAQRIACDVRVKAEQTEANGLRRAATEIAASNPRCNAAAGAYRSAYLPLLESAGSEGQIAEMMARQQPFSTECLRPADIAGSEEAAHVAIVRRPFDDQPHCAALLLRHVVVTAAHCWQDSRKQPIRALRIAPLSGSAEFIVSLPFDQEQPEHLFVRQDFVALPYPAAAQPPARDIAVLPMTQGAVRTLGHFRLWSADTSPRMSANVMGPGTGQCQSLTATGGCISLLCQTTAGFSGAPVFVGSGPDLAVVGLISRGEPSAHSLDGCSKLGIESITYAVVLPENIDRPLEEDVSG